MARTDVRSEVLGGEYAATSEEIKKRKGIQMLPFASEANRVAPRDPGQDVTELVAIELGALRNPKVGPILQARKPNLISRGKACGIGHRVIGTERWNGIEEPVAVKHQAVDPLGRNLPVPIRQQGTETVQG